MRIERSERGTVLSVTIFGVTIMREQRYRLLKNIIILAKANEELCNQPNGYDYKIGGF